MNAAQAVLVAAAAATLTAAIEGGGAGLDRAVDRALIAASEAGRAGHPGARARRGGQAARSRARARRASGRGGVGLVRLGTFDQPLYVTQPPGDRRRLFVVEKTGRIRVIRGGRVLRRPFLSLRGQVSTGGEQGLLSMAFAPDYRRSRRFYVDFTNRRGNTRIVEFRRARRSADRADRSSRRLVLRIHQPFANHNGGLLLFGSDRLLYIGSGDGGGAGDPDGNGQSRATLLGKVLRIDPRPTRRRRYRVPGGNPFVRMRGARDEIYAYGLRNPWRFSFDRATGALTIADVGQNRFEEIDYVRRGRGRGANFGWRAYEANTRFDPAVDAPGHVPPIHAYTHARGCSVTGGYVVRDRRLRSLYGRYVYGDFCSGRLSSLIPSPDGARDMRSLGIRIRSLSSFGEDRRGRIYATSLAGPVYRLAPRR